MKRQFINLAIFAIITLFTATFAAAQTNLATRSKIDFDFYVGDQKMPAGEYVIEHLSPQSNKTLLVLRCLNCMDEPVILRTNPILVARKTETSLLFNRYGAVFYMSEIRNGYTEWGVKLIPFKDEIKLAREFRKSKRDTATVKSGGDQNGHHAPNTVH